jgi:cold shock protein
MTIGTVRFFSMTNGFGFIQPDNGSTDVFVYIPAVERAGLSSIADGQKLRFDAVKNKRNGKSVAENLQTM